MDRGVDPSHLVEIMTIWWHACKLIQ
jgi:hypothetical protein